MYFLTTIARFLGWFRSRPEQQISLLRTMKMSVESGLPFAPAIAALANDETGFHANRVRRLGRLLQNGHSVSEALELSPNVLSDSARSQVQFGIESGTLKSAVDDAIDVVDDTPHDALRRCYDALITLAVTAFFITCIMSFAMIKIVPIFRVIFEDFDLPVPPPLEILIEGADTVATIAPFFLVLAFCFFLWVWFGNPVRWLRRSFLHPIIRRFFDTDTPDLLRQIALARQAGKPIAGTMSTLARCHHNPRTRRQLLKAWNSVEQGTDPWLALQKQGLINSEEMRLILAAETIDNSPWALRQLGDLRRAKTNERLQVMSRIVPPLLILPLGIFVAFFAVGFLVGLAGLVMNLSS